MIIQKVYENGLLFGWFYLFTEACDIVPMHDHKHGRKHNIIVLRGSVSVQGTNWSIPLQSGDVFNFSETQYPHEIKAIYPDTLILNLSIEPKLTADAYLVDGYLSSLPELDTGDLDAKLIQQPKICTVVPYD